MKDFPQHALPRIIVSLITTLTMVHYAKKK